MRAVILNKLKDLMLAGGSHELICVIKDHQRGPSFALGMTHITKSSDPVEAILKISPRTLINTGLQAGGFSAESEHEPF